MPTRTKAEAAYETSVAASVKNAPVVADAARVNKMIRQLKHHDVSRYKVRTPKIRQAKEDGWRILVHADCGEGEMSRDEWSKAQGGRIIGLMKNDDVGAAGDICAVDVSTRKLKRATHSSFDGECINSIDALDVALGVQEIVHEWHWGVRPAKQELVKIWLDTGHWPELEVYSTPPKHWVVGSPFKLR